MNSRGGEIKYMLEVFAIIALCKSNRANARARGKSVGGITALTICLWIGMEIFGIIVGIILSAFILDTDASETAVEFVMILCGLSFAALGGLISHLCSKRGKIVEQSQQLPLYMPTGSNAGYYGSNSGSQPMNSSAFVSGCYCPTCGQYNDSSAEFCEFCGNKLKS